MAYTDVRVVGAHARPGQREARPGRAALGEVWQAEARQGIQGGQQTPRCESVAPTQDPAG